MRHHKTELGRIWRTAALTLRRSSFFSVPELIKTIEEYLKETNRQPKPFIWTATVQKILEKVNRCKVISETGH